MAKATESVTFKILARMKRGPPSRVWTPRDFIDLGTRTAVDVALHRLEAQNLVRRISRALYDVPRFEKGVLVPPDCAAVLAAISRRDGVKVLVDERSAAQELGLVPGTPTRIVVLTSRRLENISLGSRTIFFRTVASRQLIWAGRPAADLVQAMRYLRELLNTNSKLLPRLRAILNGGGGDVIRSDLERGLGDLPTWLVPHDIVAYQRKSGDGVWQTISMWIIRQPAAR